MGGGVIVWLGSIGVIDSRASVKRGGSQIWTDTCVGYTRVDARRFKTSHGDVMIYIFFTRVQFGAQCLLVASHSGINK